MKKVKFYSEKNDTRTKAELKKALNDLEMHIILKYDPLGVLGDDEDDIEVSYTGK